MQNDWVVGGGGGRLGCWVYVPTNVKSKPTPLDLWEQAEVFAVELKFRQSNQKAA